MNKPIIFWFRQDLRTDDLPGLAAAAATGRAIIPCYILDEVTAGDWVPGGASRWWLHHSLQSLSGALKNLGGTLILRRGNPQAVLQSLLQETDADTIHCTRQYEPWATELEQSLFQTMEQLGVSFKRYPGNLLFEPGRIMNQAGLPYKVFTPFWRNCRNSFATRLAKLR